MKLIIYLTLIFFLCNGCSKSLPIIEHEPPEYEKMADKITAQIVKKLEAETNLTFTGIGGGMMDQINMMAISFNHQGELSIEQARELLVYCVNEYLTAINGDTKIRPYLVHYPFTSKDVEIRIFINKANQTDVPIGSLSMISEVDGTVKYKIREPFPEVLRTIYEESYEEAIKALEPGGTIKKVRKNIAHI